MRSRGGIFWHSLWLTLLLLLPIIAVLAFFVNQRQRQNELRQAAAERGGLQIEPGAQEVWRLLLVVQQEEPAFVLARVDAPLQAITLCALPGSLQVEAPSGTTTLAACAMSAGAGRAAQLLTRTMETGETALPSLYYLAATPATWAACAPEDTELRFDTALLLDEAAREQIGCGDDPVVTVPADEAGTLIETLQGALQTDSARANARAAVWAVLLRQNPELPAALPEAWRTYSARTLTDLQATDLTGLEQSLGYLASRPSLQIDYTAAAAAPAAGGELALTEEGAETLYRLLQ